MLDRYAPASISHPRRRAWGLICGGSVPPGLPRDTHAHLLRHARRRGLYTLLDSSGKSLRQGVAGLPHVLKVNRDELAALDPKMGDEREGIDDLCDLAERLGARLGEWASEALIVTLGERGTLAVTPEGWYLAQPPPVPVVNTAGCGDAISGGLMLARSRGQDWPEALALGTAAAASVLTTGGTGICRREQVEELLPQVQVTRQPC